MFDTCLGTKAVSIKNAASWILRETIDHQTVEVAFAATGSRPHSTVALVHSHRTGVRPMDRRIHSLPSRPVRSLAASGRNGERRGKSVPNVFGRRAKSCGEHSKPGSVGAVVLVSKGLETRDLHWRKNILRQDDRPPGNMSFPLITTCRRCRLQQAVDDRLFGRLATSLSHPTRFAKLGFVAEPLEPSSSLLLGGRARRCCGILGRTAVPEGCDVLSIPLVPRLAELSNKLRMRGGQIVLFADILRQIV